MTLKYWYIHVGSDLGQKHLGLIRRRTISSGKKWTILTKDIVYILFLKQKCVAAVRVKSIVRHWRTKLNGIQRQEQWQGIIINSKEEDPNLMKLWEYKDRTEKDPVRKTSNWVKWAKRYRSNGIFICYFESFKFSETVLKRCSRQCLVSSPKKITKIVFIFCYEGSALDFDSSNFNMSPHSVLWRILWLNKCWWFVFRHTGAA